MNPVRGCHTVVMWYARPTGCPRPAPNSRPELFNSTGNNERKNLCRPTETVEVALKAPALMVCAHGTIPAVQLLLCAIKSCVEVVCSKVTGAGKFRLQEG